MREIEYRPKNIRETLVELKDSSELAVDLAYSAVLFDNDALASEVVELEARANYLQYHARIALMLAAKNTTDAERLVGIFQVVDGAVDITEAAGDIARIQQRDLGIPTAFGTLTDAHERFVRAPIADDSALAGHTLHELALDVDEGVRVIAIRRDTEWVFAPGGNDRLLAGDVVFARGPNEGIDEMCELATGEPPEPHVSGVQDGHAERAIETVVELKNVSELAIGLSYSAALFDSDAIAGEVRVLERRADELRQELEQWVVDAAARAGPGGGGGGDSGGAGSGGAGEDGDRGGPGAGTDGDRLRGLFHLAVAAETICDAALDVAEVVFREVELHPVFGQAVSESNEVITSVEVTGGRLEGATVGELNEEIETGMTLLALDREDGWVYDPDEGTTFRVGDRLVLKGPRRGEDRIRRLAS